MSQKDKLIKNLENNPKNASLETIKSLLLSHGWELDRIKGSHHMFIKGNKILNIPYHKPIKPFYVKMALKAIKGE